MPNHTNLNELFTDIADAIRSKTGNTAAIVADNFPSEIEAIQTGSSGGSVEPKDVNFYDYDGTLLHSYTVEEAQSLNELPELPEQPGLICQGWNYNLETIKEYNRAVNVGATYITDDGTTRLYIHLEDGRTSPMLGVCVNGTVTVDWGDGTAPDILTGTSTSSTQWTPNHAYVEPGDYVIRLTVDGKIAFTGSNYNDDASSILSFTSDDSNINRVYKNSLLKVELGNATSIGHYVFNNCHSLTSITIPEGATFIGDYAFNNCYSLTSITIPKGLKYIYDKAFCGCYSLTSTTIPEGVTFIYANAFNNCYSLASITIPNSTGSLGQYVFQNCRSLTSITVPCINNYAFNYCYSLKSITILDSATFIGKYAFEDCRSLASITIPSSVTSIDYGAFQKCYSLVSITIPDSVTTIYNTAFDGCTGIRYFDFTSHTAVPTLTGTGVFTNIPEDFEILVPAALYGEWIAATNWATYADHITYKEGFSVSSVSTQRVVTNTTANMIVPLLTKSDITAPTIDILSDDASIVSIANVELINNDISFDIVAHDIEGSAEITITASNETQTQTVSFNVLVRDEFLPPTYTVESIDGTTYGFELNDNGYYESQNKGISSSYAICKVKVNTDYEVRMYVNCINSAEQNYDYGILSTLDTTLTLSSSPDSTNVHHNFKGLSSTTIQTVTYDITSGEHFIYVKFIKDSGGNSGNDTLQFKIGFD